MKSRLSTSALAVLALIACNAASADIGVGLKAGTLGLGLEARWSPLPWLDVRMGVNSFEYDDNGSQAGINYDATFSLDTYYATGNFRFPLSPFRVTAGVVSNGNEFSMVSQDTGGQPFDIGNNTFSAADVGTLQRMPKLVPEGIVRELAYTGRRWSAAEAKAAGFVNETFPDRETMLDGVLGVASEIASKSPMAVWGTKQTMHYTRDHGVADGLEYIANWNAAMFDTDDMGEAAAAQMEGRDADFPDLYPLSPGL